MERIVPRRVGSDHGIKYGQKLAHAGNQRDLGQFAGGLQALIEGFDGRIVAGGGKGGHVKHATDFKATTLNASSAIAGAGIASNRRDADESRNLATAELTQFGQFCDQASTGYRTDAVSRLQQAVEFTEVLAYVSDHLCVDVVELSLNGSNDSQQAGMQTDRRNLQPLSFREEHGEQLATAGQQSSQPLLALIGNGAQQAGQIFATHQDRSQFGEHASIDAIGLGQTPHRAGKIARLSRIDDRDRQTGALQSASHFRLVAAGRFHHDQRHVQRLQGDGQGRMALRIVIESLGVQMGTQHGNIDMVFCHVNADRY
ncbi:hypothetical protein WM33_16440 [Burkholderia multivorans]|nr:hypothetical protein WM33_16440 [Burkholderia multivorans]KVZ83269.1 hypothetical protein WL23_08635 [Burkholderia multivorans]